MSATRVAVITVSDSASLDPHADKSGPIIKAIVLSHHSCQVQDAYCAIVPDDKGAIETHVDNCCSSGQVDWIITTGGTGFGVRDVTPEAIAPLIQRPAPGLVHLMLSSSLNQTPLAALSRPVAGTILNTLITTLPGSPKAVKENLEALFQAGVIEHAIDLIKGGSGRQVHAALSRSESSGEASSSHHHHHHDPEHHHTHHHHHTPTPRSEGALSHDPSASVSARHRKSPFPQISLEAALDLIRENIHVLPVQKRKVDHKLGGYILAEDMHAPKNVPFTSTTSVDGYALRSSDPPGTYTVLTSQTHTLSSSSPLPLGSIYRINTGGPLPSGTDTVIMVEDTELVSTIPDTLLEGSGRNEEREVRTLVQVPKGENVRAPGSDVRKGDVVMRKGERVTRGGGEVGTLAFVGRKEVNVYKKPIVAIMSTGNEIIDLSNSNSSDSPDQASIDGWGGIYDTNRPSLVAVLESLGYEVIDLGIVPDEISAHVNTLQKGLESADLILTTGGTSMGPTDLLKPVIERYLSGTIHFGRVGIKPGKPTTFATVPVPVPVSSLSQSQSQAEVDGFEVDEERRRTRRKPIFALPGNPASALVTFYVFVLPALRRMGGWSERMCELPTVMVQVQNTMPLDPRVEFHRVVIKSSRTCVEAFGASLSLFPSVSGSASASGSTSASASASSASVSGSENANTSTSTCTLKAYSTGGQRSSRVASLAGANGLVVLPALVIGTGEGNENENENENESVSVKTRLEVGEFARAIVIGDIEME